MLAIVSRLVSHKGLDLVRQIAEELVSNNDLQLVVLGKGAQEYEDFFRYLEGKYPDKVRALMLYDRDLSKKIYHANNASYMSPGGEEIKGLTAFKENRGLFYGEVAQYLRALNAEMDTDFGVLPVPKYDHAQEFYRTWTHGIGSTISVPSSISKPDVMAGIIETFCILSHQKLTPAYHDNMLTKRNVRDAESSEMLDIIFSNIIYDYGISFCNDLNFIPAKYFVEHPTAKLASWYASNETKLFDNYYKVYEHVLDLYG